MARMPEEEKRRLKADQANAAGGKVETAAVRTGKPETRKEA